MMTELNAQGSGGVTAHMYDRRSFLASGVSVVVGMSLQRAIAA
jgi:hypothetical protein